MSNFHRFQFKIFTNRYFILFLLTVGFTFFFNAINLSELQIHQSEKVRLNETVATSDDLIYLKPVQNWLKNIGWTDGSVGRQQYFSRPPGYSIFILPFIAVFGLNEGLFYLKIFQLLLFAGSVVVLFRILEKGIHAKKVSFFIAFLYGVFPIASGFVFYTLTEGVTPAILIFHLYFLQKAFLSKSFKLRWYLISACILGVLLLVRPVFLMFILPILIMSCMDRNYLNGLYRRIKLTLGLLIVMLLPLICWEIRVVTICGSFPGLYPVYDKEVNTIYRPTHQAIWEFGKCWGISGKDFHEHVGPIWEQKIYLDSINGDPIGRFIGIIPKNIVAEIGEKKIRNAFESYQNTVGNQRESYLLKHPLPNNFIKKELSTIRMFHSFKEHYRLKHWFNYYFVVPCKYLKAMSLHSNLNLYIFQHSWRGTYVMEFVRLISLMIHFSLFIVLFSSLLIRNVPLFTRLLSYSCILYVLFLAFYFRELEERYTLPILPILFLIAVEVIVQSNIYQYVTTRFKKV